MEQKILDEFRVEGRTRARRGKHGGPQARRDGFCTPLEIPEEGFVGHSGNDWDFNRGYQAKHGLSFTEAQQLFESGGDYLEIFDAEHSEQEDRFIAIGPIDRGIVVVVYTEREQDLIRIIGARLASNRERDLFCSYMDQYQ